MHSTNLNHSEATTSFDEFDQQHVFISSSNWKRFLNLIVDSVFYIIVYYFLYLLMVTVLIVSFPHYLSTLQRDVTELMGMLLNVLLNISFYTLMEYFSGGRSLGKLLTKTKIVTLDGAKPSFNNCLIRSLSRCIPFESFSFFGNVDKGWHDSLSNTRVVEIEN